MSVELSVEEQQYECLTLCKCNLFTYVAFAQISIVATVTIAEFLGSQ